MQWCEAEGEYKKAAISGHAPLHHTDKISKEQIMISILNEVSIDPGLVTDEVATLWIVSYKKGDTSKHHQWVIEALRDFCTSRGWQLECGLDPHQEDSLNFLDDADD